MTRMVEWLVDGTNRVMAASPTSAAMKVHGPAYGYHWEAFAPDADIPTWIAQFGRFVVSNPERGTFHCCRVEHG